MTGKRGIAQYLMMAALASAAVACQAAKETPEQSDTAPVQAAQPVPPPSGATAGPAPAPVLPETVIAKNPTGGTKSRADSARKAGDTLEYDRAIPFKPGPGKELPPVKPDSSE